MEAHGLNNATAFTFMEPLSFRRIRTYDLL